MKHLSSRPRLLGIAASAAAVVMGLSSVAASAQPPDNGTRCMAHDRNGNLYFFLPGERVTDTSGNQWVCGPNGQWFHDLSADVTGLGSGTITVPGTARLAR